MIPRILLAPFLVALLHVSWVDAAEIVPLPESVTSILKANSVVCDRPEALFLLYESTRLIKAQQPAKSTIASSYFDGMFGVVKENKTCFLQVADYEVKVSSITTMQNDWMKPASTMVYGEFEHPLLKKKMYAPLLALPGLSDYVLQLQGGVGAKNDEPTKTK
ncbi:MULTISPECIES: hypothetical protein [Pseudomonas]|nr:MULTISPECIES: hypothetical protein [Pseudomonas]